MLAIASGSAAFVSESWSSNKVSSQMEPNPSELNAPKPQAAEGGRAAPIFIDGASSPQGTKTIEALTPYQKQRVVELYSDGDLKIVNEYTRGDFQNAKLALRTGKADDVIEVEERQNGVLDVRVNGKAFEIKLAEGQMFAVRSGDGDDIVRTAANVKVDMLVDAGAGNDNISTGNGRDRVDGGAGDDKIETRAGRDDITGGAGNDRIHAGYGADIVYAGDGNDVVAGGVGRDFINGGRGDDVIDGGLGRDMLFGGNGNDNIDGGRDDDRIYSGGGEDRIETRSGKDVVFGQSGVDQIIAFDGASNHVVDVALDPGLGLSVRVEGSDTFKSRVEDDLDFMRNSPSGRAMLSELDRAADPVNGHGKSVKVEEYVGVFNSTAHAEGPSAGLQQLDPKGTPGLPENAIVSFNPDAHDDKVFLTPITLMQHEFSHAFNMVNGTEQPGHFKPQSKDPNYGEFNSELQAIGKENTGVPYDFDRDPATPPTTANPWRLTENGLREELGLPLREFYDFSHFDTMPSQSASADAFKQDPLLARMVEAATSGDLQGLRRLSEELAVSDFGKQFDRERVAAYEQNLRHNTESNVSLVADSDVQAAARGGISRS
jgi:hypothetical protein